ncbi:branched-chain amino acid ABC transporter permease [Methylobacter sp. Wu8]|uniref:branched-chain amino acid ABC transporter permease n=1 Tax=Methylobacter sp. Wu8 TaxID=3118457 RepID=UPI002F2DB358
MIQLIFNIGISSVFFILIASVVFIHYYPNKFFNLFQSAIITFAAYLAYLFSIKLTIPLTRAIPLAILCSVAIGVSTELGIFRIMRHSQNDPGQNSPSFKMLIASIGLYTILQNLISLFFGDDTKSIRTGEVKVGHEILGAYITDIQIITIAVSSVLFIAVLLLLHKTSLGKQIRAVSNNPELCNIYGINSDQVILYATALSAALAAIAGILIALDVDMTPTFGFNYFLYGVVAMIIGGVGSYRGLVFGSLLLATAQHLAAYYIDTKWMDAVAYIILILFLIWKPLGFSGQRLKKVDV